MASHRVLPLRPFALAVLVALAPQIAAGWRVERRDAVETLRMRDTAGAFAEMVCRRGGTRPGTGYMRIGFPVAADFVRNADSGPLLLRLNNGGEKLEIALPARLARGLTLPVDPPPRRGQRAGKPPAASDYLVITLDQPGAEWQAAILASATRLFADRRRRQVSVEVPELGLSTRLPGGAEREFAGFAKGCLDGIPAMDDDVQGPWHQGISSSDGETTVALTASALRPAPEAPEVKLILSCEHGEFSLKLSTPGRAIDRNFAAVLKTADSALPIAFTAGPAPEEAGADAALAPRARAALTGIETAELSTDLPGLEGPFRFDVFGLDFAARTMRTLCKGA